MNKTDDNFTWEECWVITSMLLTKKAELDINISNISKMIGIGDIINRAIYYMSDMKRAFVKAQKRGLITISDDKIRLSNIGKEIQFKMIKYQAELFEANEHRHKLVGWVQTTLNSKESNLVNIPDEEIDPCDFINRKTFQEAYEHQKEK